MNRGQKQKFWLQLLAQPSGITATSGDLIFGDMLKAANLFTKVQTLKWVHLKAEGGDSLEEEGNILHSESLEYQTVTVRRCHVFFFFAQCVLWKHDQFCWTRSNFVRNFSPSTIQLPRRNLNAKEVFCPNVMITQDWSGNGKISSLQEYLSIFHHQHYRSYK